MSIITKVNPPQALRRYLESEHEDKKKAKYDTNDWTLENMKV